MKHLLLFLILCASVFGAAQTCTFDNNAGGGDGTWNDALNWATSVEADRVPIAGDIVVIPDTFTVVIDTTALAFASITNTGGGTMTLDTDAVTCIITCTTFGNSQTNTANLLTVNGTGTLTVIGHVVGPDASSDASIITGDACTIAITGDVTGGDSSSCYGVETTHASTITVSGTITGGSTGVGIQDGAGSSSLTAGYLDFVDTKAVPLFIIFASYDIGGFKVNGTAIGGSGGGGYRSRYNFN